MSVAVEKADLRGGAEELKSLLGGYITPSEPRSERVAGRWEGVTSAAAELLLEQDLKPEGSAFPVSSVPGTRDSVVCLHDLTVAARSPRRVVWGLARPSRRGFEVSSSRREVSGESREQSRSGVERHSSGDCDDLERFAVDYHKPVLPREVCSSFSPIAGRWFLDMTLGGAGHTEMLLEKGASVVGIDQDLDALEHAQARLARYGRRFRAIHGSFACAVELIEVARRSGSNEDLPEQFEGVLMDLGVSSHQLDAAERGFSFMREGPLDMRMNGASAMDAALVVNTYAESELSRIFFEFGEEPSARRVARMIVNRRESRPFTTTVQLAAAIEEVLPRRGRVHPATRVFQALRMEVNHELEALEQGLAAACTLLAPGGTLAVISFHSLEDRIVKRFMRSGSAPEIDRPEWPAPRPNPGHVFVKGGGRHQEPQADEIAWNPRSRSAKLRCVEKLRKPKCFT